jgi:tetratricopeptide (TPR) repeat protein
MRPSISSWHGQRPGHAGRWGRWGQWVGGLAWCVAVAASAQTPVPTPAPTEVTATLPAAPGNPVAALVAADEDLRAAAEELAVYRFADAASAFGAVLRNATVGEPRWAVAAFGRATALQHWVPSSGRRLAEATDLLQQVAESGAPDELRARAVMTIGRIAEVRDFADDPVDLEEARRRYQQVIDQFPALPIADEAALRLSATYFQTIGSEESASRGFALLEDWLKRRPDNPWASAQHEFLAKQYQLLTDDHDAAVRHLIAAERLGLVNPVQAADVYFRIATMSEGLPDGLPVAVSYYQRVLSDTPRSVWTYEAWQALRRLAAAHPEMSIQVPRQASAADEPQASTPETQP